MPAAAQDPMAKSNGERTSVRTAAPAYHARQELVYRLVAPVYDFFVWPHIRPVVETAIALLEPLAGLPVLDAGTGTGNLALALAQAGAQVTAIDLSPSLLRVARRKPGGSQITWLRGNATTIPFDDGSFAYAAAAMVLHEMPEAVRDGALSELSRVSDRGLVLIDYRRDLPPRRGTRWLEALEGSHYDTYLAYPLEERLSNLGLSICQRALVGQFELVVSRATHNLSLTGICTLSSE